MKLTDEEKALLDEIYEHGGEERHELLAHFFEQRQKLQVAREVYLAPASDSLPLTHDSFWAELQETKVGRACLACGSSAVEEGHEDYDNALLVRLSGGYGLFFDGNDFHFILCHDCSHELCELAPWLGALINPLASHSHRPAYLQANPDHVGWDTLPH